MINLLTRGLVGVSHRSFFRWRQLGADIWGKLANTTDYDFGTFGVTSSISHDGTTVAAVDRFRRQFGSFNSHGAVSVHRWNGVKWQMIGQELLAENALDDFGSQIQLSANGNRLAVFARLFGTSDNGKAYIYDFNGTSWSLSTTFGGTALIPVNSISLSGDGLRFAFSTASATYVYQQTNGAWSQLGNTLSGATAISLSQDGTRLAKATTGVGNGRIHELVSGTWNELTQITGATKLRLNANGTQVAVTDFSRSQPVSVLQEGTPSWTQLGQNFPRYVYTLTNPDTNQQFNQTSSIDFEFSPTGRLIILENYKDTAISTSSLVWRMRVYDLQSGSWTQIGAEFNFRIAALSSAQTIYGQISGDGKTVSVRRGERPNSGWQTPLGVLKMYHKELS